jgi:hypothetical protein
MMNSDQPGVVPPPTTSPYLGWLQALLLPAIVAAALAVYWAAVDRDEQPNDLDFNSGTSVERRALSIASLPLADQEQAVREGLVDRIVATKEPVSAEDLSRISELPNLKSLTIGAFAGSEADFAALERFPSLETLHLHDLAVSDAGAETLSRVATLRNLNLDAATLGDAGLASLAKLPKLELLRIRSANVTDAGIAALAKSPALAHVHVIDAKLTDASLETVASMRRLESFYVDGSEFSAGAWRKFLAARPDVHVHVDSLHLPDDPQSRVKHE